MTTLTVEIDKEEDIDLLKNFLYEKGFNFKFEEEDQYDFIFTDEIKKELDEDEEAYQRGELKLITPEESRAEINRILAGKG